MTNTSRLIVGIGLAIAAALWTATASAAEAGGMVVRRIVGSGQAVVKTHDGSHRLTEGATLSASDEVQTGSGVEVYVEVSTGVVATIEPQSHVVVGSLGGDAGDLQLTSGSIISQIDRKRLADTKRTYGIGTARGVAAARGTSFTVTVGDGNSLTITTTADTVSFTSATGASFSVQAGMISITPPGATAPNAPVPLATAVATNPEIATILSNAVSTAATVVQNNIGSIGSDSATNILAQVVAAASSALPSQAASFTSQAVAAAAASTSSTAGSSTAAAAITAAAVTGAPSQAGAITAAAVQAAPAQTGVITAAAQQAAPTQKDAIAESVSNSTGQSKDAVQSNADRSANEAAQAVREAGEATQHVVLPQSTPPSNQAPSVDQNQQKEGQKEVAEPSARPQVPIVLPDASNAGG